MSVECHRRRPKASNGLNGSLFGYDHPPYNQVFPSLEEKRMATPESKVHVSEFTNEPFVDFSRPENKQAMEAALKKVESEFGREYPMYIGGEKVITTAKMTSTNPSHPQQVIGAFQTATAEHAQQAVDAAAKAFETWKRVPAEKRIEILFRAAEIIRRRKFELDALICYEIGKTWPEADADIAELIDFCEYYGREMLRLAAPQKLTPMRGEKNYLKYIPLGVGVVIPPWNFAAAIMGGMTVASIVTGNTVVLKPSSDSPTIAAIFIEILYEAGVPQDVVSFYRAGAAAGEALVNIRRRASSRLRDRRKRGCGSRSGRKDSRGRCGSSAPCWKWAARTRSIVDDEADLDAAVEGVALSAFGYQGQKCSACSRAIVSEKIYDKFLSKLVERVKKIKVGSIEDPANYMGPVINEGRDESRFWDTSTIGKKEGRLVAGGKRARRRRIFHRADGDRGRRSARREFSRRKFSGRCWR